MKRLVLLLGVVAALAALAPGQAQASGNRGARECGLPHRYPMWIDFADGQVPFWPMFARPGVVTASANFIFPAQIRARGAKTIFWEMHLRWRVGTPTAPFDPALARYWADRVFLRAVASSACATPWIALNELWGSNRPTDWSPANEQYRQDVLIFVKRLRELGAHPYLLINSRPFTDGDSADWWRQVALYTDFVREIYFAAPQISHQGPIVGSRTLRNAFRQGITDLTSIGIPPAKIGVFLGFHTNPGQGGREGLKPASAWFNHIKLQVLAIKQVQREIPFATIWSWGWGEWVPSDRDPDKPAAACVYLWTRVHSLCPQALQVAGRGFDPSLTQGQLNLGGGVQCRTPWGKIGTGRLGTLAAVTHDHEIAYTSLFAQLALKRMLKLKPQQIKAAERAIVRYRFGGSGAAYRAALARAGVTRDIARSVIADELRQASIERRFQVSAPSGTAIADYQSTYSETNARLVRALPAPSWLGERSRGVAIDGMAPPAIFRIPTGHAITLKTREGKVKVRALGPTVPLGAFSLGSAGSSIRAALVGIARDQVFDNWLMNQERSALSWTTCRRDWLPSVGPLELTTELPFLQLAL